MSRWDSIGSCRLVADCSRVVVPVKYASRSDIKTIQTPVIAHGAALRAMVGVSIQNANMATKIPSKVSDRISAGVKRFQPILESAKSRDVGESDTVTIIADMLSEVFGFDKYSEVTSEFAIRGTYCDLAIKLDNQLQMLIEAKAIGSELREGHLKQAVDYAANQGADWVVLTNGTIWRIYKVIFGKPIDQELVFEVNFATISHKSAKDIESI